MIAFDRNGNQIEVDKDLGQNDLDLTTLPTPTGTDEEKLAGLVNQFGHMFWHGARTPVMKRPDDVGMEFEEVFFPSMDGVPLEGWYIPAKGSDKLLVINHPMTCNRYGFPGHLEPWNEMFGGFEVDFLTELRHLHNAGYNILTYDLRNHGLSSDANGVTSGLGLLEARDVVGSMRYVRSRADLSAMKLALFSRCMGANSTIIAMNRWSEEFEGVQALGMVNAVSGHAFIEQGARNLGLDPHTAQEALAERLLATAGQRLDEETPEPYGAAVKVPAFLAVLRRDFLVDAVKDGQEIFDSLGSEDKELLWIEDSNQRFYAYNYFGQHPEKLIAFFDTHVG
ncbi:MAG: alpha/beta hydrolase [Kocuria sp.]|nr:alpha/beta hydrolase [Kocuria sp.]